MDVVKWYGDAVDPNGHVTIAYLGRLNVGPFTLGYRGLIDDRGRGRSEFTRQAHALPVTDGSGSLVLPSADGPLCWTGAQARAQTLWAQAGNTEFP